MIAIKGMDMPQNCSECSFKTNDYVCGLLDCAFSCNHFTERNYNCPLVEIEKDGWIPCGERLPENEEKETENLTAKYYLVQNEYGDMMVARWDGKGWEQMYQHEYLEDDVVAWMSLPERYEYEGDRDD